MQPGGSDQGSDLGWSHISANLRKQPPGSELVNPSKFDVLLGRGKSNYSNPGNQRYEGASQKLTLDNVIENYLNHRFKKNEITRLRFHFV